MDQISGLLLRKLSFRGMLLRDLLFRGLLLRDLPFQGLLLRDFIQWVVTERPLPNKEWDHIFRTNLNEDEDRIPFQSTGPDVLPHSEPASR